MIVFALAGKYWAPDFYASATVFTHALGVTNSDDPGIFALLQSALHTEWAWKMSSSLKQDLRYTPSDIFETFPFPATFP